MICFIKLSRALIPAAIFFILCTAAQADTVKLDDGSVFIGKIIKEERKYYLFGNSYGTFEIKKKIIKKVFVTQSYKEDVAINKKLGKKVNEAVIKKDYIAGERKKMLTTNKSSSDVDKKEKEYSELWDYGRLHLSATYFSTILTSLVSDYQVSDVLPGGFSGQIAYEQGLDMVFKKRFNAAESKKSSSSEKVNKRKKRPMLMPGLRIEFSYLYFTEKLFVENEREVSGSTVTVGPMWAFPSPHNYWGCFVLAGQPGIALLKVNNRIANKEIYNCTITFTGIFGYEYAIKQKVALALHVRYTYIRDVDVEFHGIGGSLGVSIRLW